MTKTRLANKGGCHNFQPMLVVALGLPAYGFHTERPQKPPCRSWRQVRSCTSDYVWVLEFRARPLLCPMTPCNPVMEARMPL